MKRLAICLLAVSGLTACANPDGSYGSTGSKEWFDSASTEVINSHYRGVCESYGFTADTPDMARCIQREVSTNRREADIAYHRQIRELEESSARIEAEREAFMKGN
jgi:hypothetical protein